MAKESTDNKQAVTSGKLALIGLLSVVLVAVVYRNFFHETAPNEAARNDRGPQAAAGNDRGPNVDKNNGESTQQGRKQPIDERQSSSERVRLHAKPWPKYKLAEVVDCNPFALPSAFPRPRKVTMNDGEPMVATIRSAAEQAAERQAAAAARAATIAAIRAKGVQVILQHGQEYVAVINGREVRINDDLNGFTVVHIGNDGITLEGRTE